MPNLQTSQGSVPVLAEIGRSSLAQYGGTIQADYDPDLRNQRGVKIFDEMRRSDPLVALGLRAIKWVVGQVSWTPEPAGDTPADKEAAEFVQSCMDDMSMPWSRVIQDALTCLDFGWAYSEVCYKLRNGDAGDPASLYDDGRVGWRKIVLIGQQSLNRWLIDETGGIQGLVQSLQQGGEATIPIEKALLFRLDAEQNNPEGVSLLRSIYLPWYKKRQLEEIEAIGAERDLTGVAKITLPVGATSDDFTRARTILEQYHVDDMSGFVLPRIGSGDAEKWDVEIINSPGSKSIDTDKIIQRYSFEIARGFMSQFLLMGQAAGATGSWALAREQTDLFYTAIMTIVQMIADILNRFLVPPLFRLNDFGQLSGLPRMQPGRLARQDLETFSKALLTLQQAALLTPDPDLEKYLREQFQLPEPVENAEAAGKPEPEETGQEAKQESELLEFDNPYHDKHGRFDNAPPGSGKGGGGGSSGGGGGSSATPAQVVESIRNSPTEHAVGIGADGAVAFKTSSDSGSFVYFTNQQLAAVKGGTLVHNHPSSESFSPPDLLVAARSKVAELQVVSPKYTYTLRADPKRWQSISDAYTRAKSKTSDAAAAHGVLEKLAAKMGFTYTREAAPPLTASEPEPVQTDEEPDELDTADDYENSDEAQVDEVLREIERQAENRSFAERIRLARPAERERNRINLDKALDGLRDRFSRHMSDLARDFREGKITYDAWASQGKAEIQQNVRAAQKIGLAQSRGVWPPSAVKLTDAQRIAANRMVDDQLRYFSGFRKDVREQVAAGKQLSTAVDARAELYAGAVKSASEEAKLGAEPKVRLQWVRHKSDSCETCLANDGKIKTAAEWTAGGVWPAHNTRCVSRCGCSLEGISD